MLPTKGKFSPRNISGLTLWLDYRYGWDGNTWQDRSGNGYHATESTNPPTLAADGLQFDGVNDVLNFTAFAFTTCTVFVTGTATNGASNNRWMAFCNGIGSDFDIADGVAFAGGQLVKKTPDLNLAYTKSANPNIVTYRFGGGNADVFRDGISIGTDTYTDQSEINPTQASIGAGFVTGVTALWFPCKIKNILFYNRPLTTSELILVHRYLGQQHGISVP